MGKAKPLCFTAMTYPEDETRQSLHTQVLLDVARALEEDVGSGDLTAGLIDPQRRTRARILAREAAVICGAPWAEAALRALDPTVQITWHVAEGQRCEAPTAFANFPGESIYKPPPRSWADRAYNIVRWSEMPRGGHFAAMEEPGLFVEDVRAWARGV